MVNWPQFNCSQVDDDDGGSTEQGVDRAPANFSVHRQSRCHQSSERSTRSFVDAKNWESTSESFIDTSVMRSVHCCLFLSTSTGPTDRHIHALVKSGF